MDISVEREASFETSTRDKKKAEEQPIFSSDPFPFDVEADFFKRHDGAKVLSKTSPNNVKDFNEIFSDVNFPSPVNPVGRNNFDSFIADLENETPAKILFPDDHEPIGNFAKLDDEEEIIENLDDDGFPKASFTPGLVFSINERYQEQKADPNDLMTPEDRSNSGDQESVKSRSTDWKVSSGEGMQTLLSKNCLTLPSWGDLKTSSTSESNVNNGNKVNGVCKQQESVNDDGEQSKTSNSSREETPSHWERLMEKLPQASRVKASILQARRKLLACHEPDPVVVFDDDVDISSIGIDPSKDKDREPDSTETVLNESRFSYKSLQQFSATVLSTSQDILSIPSDVSTPIRTQTKGKSGTDHSRCHLFGNTLNDPTSFQHSGDNDKSSNSTLKLCIDLYEQSAFETLMSNLKGNVEVRELHVFRSWEGKEDRVRTLDDVNLLFETIRSLSNLEMLNFNNFLEEEVHLVALNPLQNEHLQAIRIHLCNGALSKYMLEVLAELPALRHLTLEMNHSFPFHILLNSSTLESLTIGANGFNIDNLHAMEMVQKLPRNDTLKKLTVEPPLNLRTFRLLVSALSKNIGIECLQFSLIPGNQTDTNRAINELTRTLGTNASLKSIRNLNYSKIKVKDRVCDAVMKALSDNYIIEEFLVFDEEPWFRDRKNRILKENKLEFESIFPQMFSCGDDVDKLKCLDDDDIKNEDDASVDGDSPSAGGGFASIGDNVKSQAKRVASGALNFVGQTVGLV